MDFPSAPGADDGLRLAVPTTARACSRYFAIAESNLAVSALVRSMANDRPRYENSTVSPSPSAISFPDRSLTSFVITRVATSLDLLVRKWDRAHYCPGPCRGPSRGNADNELGRIMSVSGTQHVPVSPTGGHAPAETGGG